MPALRQASRNGADVPKLVVPVSAATRHSQPRSGFVRHYSCRINVEVGDLDDRLQRGQRRADGRDLLAAVDGLVAVAVAVDGDQDLGLDLLPAVDDRAGAELRCATGEDGAQAGG